MRAKPLGSHRGETQKFRWLPKLAVLVGLAAGGYFFFNHLVNTKLRPLIESEMAKAVHSPVSIESMRGGLTGSVVLNKVALTIPGSPWQTRLEVEKVEVSLELLNLLLRRKPLENSFKSISFIRPNIYLTRVETPPKRPGAEPTQVVSETKTAVPLIPVPQIVVRHGVFFIQAGKNPQPMLSDLNFKASTEGGAIWSLDLHARSPEAKSRGVIRFNGSLRLEDFKLSGKALLEQWPLASANSVLKELAGWQLISGTIDAESPITFQLGQGLSYDAKANLTQAAIRSPAPASIILSQISGQAFIRPNEISVPGEIRFQLGNTPWRATGLIPLDNRPLSVRTTTNQLFLASVFTEILKLPNLKVDGVGTATLSVSGPFTDPLIRGTAELGSSQVGDWRLDSLSVKAGYEKGKVRLVEAAGKLYDGDFKADGFLSLTGEKDAPVSLQARLRNIEAKKLAATLGISGMEGRSDAEVRVGGTLDHLSLSAANQMDLTRTIRNSLVHYLVRTNLQLKDQKLTLSAVINDKTKLDSFLVEKPDSWEIQKFTVTTNKKGGKLTGTGVWPKADGKPIDIQIHGKDISLQDLPFFADQFPDLSGRVSLENRWSGIPKDLRTSLKLSGVVVLKNLKNTACGSDDPTDAAYPLDLSLNGKSGELEFEKLTVGNILSVSGKLGLTPESKNDLIIRAEVVPAGLIAEVLNWNNPPQPFEGCVTGQFHMAGLVKNPILDGKGTIDSLKMGDWYADRVDLLLSLENEKLQIKNFKLTQGNRALSAVGSWDTRPQTGAMNLRFFAKEIQLGQGPFLSGDFLLNAQTKELFLGNFTGSFSSPLVSIADLKKKTYRFNDFSMTASSENWVVKGKVKVGKAISGSAKLDMASSPVKIQSLLKIEPIFIAEASELTQFLPAGLKVSGKISGQLQLKNGSFEELPMESAFTITNGSIQSYNFDRMEFKSSGNKSKIAPSFTLTREEAQYSLSGVLESPKAFWDTDAKIMIRGPFKKEKLSNLLALMGINTANHKVAGQVDGDLTVSGSVSSPTVAFSVTGENLRYDSNVVPSAQLRFTESAGKIHLEKNKITLAKGQIDIEKGDLSLDPEDSSVVVLDLSGSAIDVPIAIFNMTNRVHMSGRLALDEKETRPTFEGKVSFSEMGLPTKNSKPFEVALSVHKKIIEFKPVSDTQVQLVGKMDISTEKKIIFDNLHLEHAEGSFSIDGFLDLKGVCHLVSDAKDVPIEAIGKWFFPNFPLSGTGNYHLVFDGSFDNPLFTTSISVSGGKIGDLKFDLLDGQLKAKNNTVFVGTAEAPMVLSRKGYFTFNILGKTPIALTKTGWLKIKDKEMDITAEMAKGDFSLILLAGFAKEAEGSMDFAAHVGGTLDNPVVTMDLDLKKCRVVPMMVAQSIDDLSGRIKVRNNNLTVEDLNGRIGQGRVFISSTKPMVLENFIPKTLEFSVRTVGDHGVWLSIPTIMKKGEWGEIFFYGQTRDEPMLIKGPMSEPHVIGTAFLDSGHYTFPPEEAVDDKGEKIEYRQLAGVFFELKLAAGKNIWYSNEFNSQYLELKVDPGNEIMIVGKDADRTPQEAGIKCYGSAGSRTGWLRYLSHQFQLEEASLTMVKGKPPFMAGHAVDKLRDVDVISAGGIRKSDVDIWLDFKGTFGNITFNLDSSPRFSTDMEAHKTILLSYIMFGRDMTNYTYSKDELRNAYEKNVGQVVTQAGFETIDRIVSAELTKKVRNFGLKNIGVEIGVKESLVKESLSGNPAATPGIGGADAIGNSLSGNSVPLVQVELRKSIDDRLSVVNTFGLTKDRATEKAGIGIQEQFGVDYMVNKNLTLNATTGQNDSGQFEAKGMVNYRLTLPDVISAKKDDKTPPRVLRFDVFPIGSGKFKLIWETDEVTKSELRIFNSEGVMDRFVAEKGDFTYDHQMVVEGLKSDMAYKVQLSVKDPNSNETITVQKISPTSE